MLDKTMYRDIAEIKKRLESLIHNIEDLDDTNLTKELAERGFRLNLDIFIEWV